MQATMTVLLDGKEVSIAEVLLVARHSKKVSLAGNASRAMSKTREIVEQLAHDQPAYGVTTGFGALANKSIPVERRNELQASLVRSHAAGMGKAIEPEVVRAMMFLRARTLAMGYSGVRPVVVEKILEVLNANIVPYVPEHGSLGASGDLAPLAHVGLVLIGEGRVINGEQATPAANALAANGIKPLALAMKEGLALTNGTDGMLAMLCLAVHDARYLLTVADVVAACSIEALHGTDRAFAPDLMSLRPQPGQQVSAANLRAMLQGSPIIETHRRVQDAYSLRCTPQVHGAARDTLGFVTQTVTHELAAAIDNPMVLPPGRIESCGNFHGVPLALAADYLAIALSEVGAIAERRLDRMLDPNRSAGLPAFLAHDPGVDSGLMLGQYSAAAMCAENRRLAAPASVDSLPTSAMQEDHVSMGWAAARKLRLVIDNLRRILAIEWVASARAIELRAQTAQATRAAVQVLRARVAGYGPDRELSPELEAAEQLLRDELLIGDIEALVGEIL